MIRFLLIVLMFALPGQSIWAAAAGYCAHEIDPASFHIGHHVHKHHTSSPDEGKKADAEPAKPFKSTVAQADTDCSYCHALAAQFAPTKSTMSGPPPDHVLASSTVPFLGNGVEKNIERPKWTRAN